MRNAHPVEQAVGIAYYVSDIDGTGGRLRASPEDFVVREKEAFDAEPVGADPGAYPHLLLRVTLENWETNDFAGTLSDHLGISRERISWAGTKDKRAVTTQLFSVDGVDPGDIPEFDRANWEVLGRTGRPILFGDLAGNAFEITVRDPESPATAAKISRHLRAFAGEDESTDTSGVGVPNFFGHQRFGSRRPVTHEVGLAIVRRDWEDAVMAYVGNPSPREREKTRKARRYVEETRDWSGALERYPRYLGYERSMLHRLVTGEDDPADFRAALETVPTNLQQLFVHAAQSYAFNRMLSERLARGLAFHRPVEGDVVCFADADAPPELSLPDTGRIQQVTGDRLGTVRRHCERNSAFVTAPLVGTETTLANGDPGSIEREVLTDMDIAPSDFDLPGDFGSTGTRRAILLQTDLEVGYNPFMFEFTLPRGAYATVLLREYLKTDPSDL